MDRVEYQSLVIQDLINYQKSEELDLNPWYQRRSVWTTPQKSYLINTLLENKPIPSLYIRHYVDLKRERSIKEVVDGQQRIRSVLEFVSDEFTVWHPKHSSRIHYSDLSPQLKKEFLMTSLSVGTLIGASEEDVIEIFGRLNSVSKTLNLQEKRNAQFSGEFKHFCLKQAASRIQFWRDNNIFSANDIARMNEIQFISELAINLMNGLVDYNAKAITDTYSEFDDKFPKKKSLADRMEKVFAKLANLDISTIRDTAFSRAPLFFTLFMVLDEAKCSIPTTKLETGISRIDRKLESDTPVAERSKSDAEFYVACNSNMHRIKSRKIRHSYVKTHLGLN